MIKRNSQEHIAVNPVQITSKYSAQSFGYLPQQRIPRLHTEQLVIFPKGTDVHAIQTETSSFIIGNHHIRIPDILHSVSDSKDRIVVNCLFHLLPVMVDRLG